MKKGFFFIVGVGILFVMGNAYGETFDTFRGLKWGADRNSISGLIVGPQKDNVEAYTREEKKSVGEVDVENIYYFFHRGKFGGALITFRGSRNSSAIKESLHQKYGPSLPDSSAEKLIWELKDLKVIFQYANSDQSGSIEYYFKPIVQQREEEKTKAQQQDTQKRMNDL
jgi:hypothetical protein